jgi:hypothetical protein
MEREDIWLEPSEEALFNAEAHKHNEEFLPLIDTDLYLSAFLHVHRRHNPLVPRWAIGCSASNFVSEVTAQWDFQATIHRNPQDKNEKRAMAIGAARRLCSLPLQMDRESPHDENYISTAQKRGLLYHVRADIPSPHVYVVQRYDGMDAANRLEGAEALSILAHLFATLMVGVPTFTGIPLQRYGPYERTRPPTIGKFPSPDRRLCSSLAYTAFNVRAGRGRGVFVKLPFDLLGGEQPDDSIMSFTKEDFRQRAQVNDAKNPLQVTMSAIAGKLCEFEDLGRNVSYLP